MTLRESCNLLALDYQAIAHVLMYLTPQSQLLMQLLNSSVSIEAVIRVPRKLRISTWYQTNQSWTLESLQVPDFPYPYWSTCTSRELLKYLDFWYLYDDRRAWFQQRLLSPKTKSSLTGGSTYRVWAFKVTQVLRQKKLWHIVEPTQSSGASSVD